MIAPNDIERRYHDASQLTGNSLKTVAYSQKIRDISSLSLPEVENIINRIAGIIPAGNVPGVILNGLARLSGRRPPPPTIRRDINLIFKGIEQTVDRLVYATFFAGPAAVILGYQKLLQLAGINPSDAFPEGLWQFYVEYALRDDTARHTNETAGFDAVLKAHGMRMTQVDRLTAWVMAAVHILHQYDDILANEWRERVYTDTYVQLCQGTAEAKQARRLYSDWEKTRPFGRIAETRPQENYPAFRQRKFNEYLASATQSFPDSIKQAWQQQVSAAASEKLPAYQQQMSILASLKPGPYEEERVPIAWQKANIGFIIAGHYYFIPVCLPDNNQPIDAGTVRAQIAAVLSSNADKSPAQLQPLARLKRSALANIRDQLDPTLVQELNTFRQTPILINFDVHPGRRPLAQIRQAERGIGHHPLTLFDTGETMVFDQSHIFFDGSWGAALAEMITNEALSWAVYLCKLPAAQPARSRPHSPTFTFSPNDWQQIQSAPQVALEASAENNTVNLPAILSLRKLFKRRNDLLNLTVNDLLILYRAIHAISYEPDARLVADLEQMGQQPELSEAIRVTLQAIAHPTQVNPAILIPVDASRRNPADRVHPLSFEVPLGDLDLTSLHQRTMESLDGYNRARHDRATNYEQFDSLQRHYLATLAAFGAVMTQIKQAAQIGETHSAGTIKLMAHVPKPLVQLLDKIPGQFDVLNDLIKGREVFSNIGAVVRTSSLTRFITAKDDNEKKSLGWGILTTANGTMVVTLRDFRPHVAQLAAAGHIDLVHRIAQDYLDAYIRGLNQYLFDLHRLTMASRETHATQPSRP
ncbi:MAG: hypothetical protein IPL78_23460 [Chloroflexi bacterium]|nr:hypothetical protein [Chloroflexota bacterium]